MCIKQNSSYMAGYQDAVAKFQSIFPAYQDSLVSYSLTIEHATRSDFLERAGFSKATFAFSSESKPFEEGKRIIIGCILRE